MAAVESDGMYSLRFPDIDNYSVGEKAAYDEKWAEIGDVRVWEKMGYGVRVHQQIRARDLWNLICICATYSAEPGIFFIDNANEMTNAVGYQQQVVCTNPCGEQPLAPYSVCNLAAINLANMVDFEANDVDWKKLERTIHVSVRMQDNVIDRTNYFLAENKRQALGERRVGLGIMGLHDLMIYCNLRYGSKKGNIFVNKLFKFIATQAYKTSIDLAKEKGSFPFLEQYGSRQKFIESGYMQGMPSEIREGVLKYGIRNSHLLTIAPTGSTGTMVGVSTGLEPYFAFKYFRSGRLGKFMEVDAPIIHQYLERHPEYSEDSLPDIFVSAWNFPLMNMLLFSDHSRCGVFDIETSMLRRGQAWNKWRNCISTYIKTKLKAEPSMLMEAVIHKFLHSKVIKPYLSKLKLPILALRLRSRSQKHLRVKFTCEAKSVKTSVWKLVIFVRFAMKGRLKTLGDAIHAPTAMPN
jgi:ribonucleoside-diphosphate reductase alpha chain